MEGAIGSSLRIISRLLAAHEQELIDIIKNKRCMISPGILHGGWRGTAKTSDERIPYFWLK